MTVSTYFLLSLCSCRPSIRPAFCFIKNLTIFFVLPVPGYLPACPPACLPVCRVVGFFFFFTLSILPSLFIISLCFYYVTTCCSLAWFPALSTSFYFFKFVGFPARNPPDCPSVLMGLPFPRFHSLPFCTRRSFPAFHCLLSIRFELKISLIFLPSRLLVEFNNVSYNSSLLVRCLFVFGVEASYNPDGFVWASRRIFFVSSFWGFYFPLSPLPEPSQGIPEQK